MISDRAIILEYHDTGFDIYFHEKLKVQNTEVPSTYRTPGTYLRRPTDAA